MDAPAINHPWVDSSSAPLYLVRFPASATDQELHAYFRAVETWSTRVRCPIAWVIDVSRVTQVPAHQRAAFAKYMESMQSFDRLYTKATALILPSALLRGFATAVFWLYKPLFHHQTFAECEEGFAWARSVLRNERKPSTIPPSDFGANSSDSSGL